MREILLCSSCARNGSWKRVSAIIRPDTVKPITHQVAGALVATLVLASCRSTPHRMNLLLVTIDTLRADALGCYGGPAATPALDALAARGVRFDFAHAHAVTTLASHASILTGRYPFEHGIRDNSGYRLPPGSKTARQPRLVSSANWPFCMPATIS